jgi:hypothetical protein
MLSAARTALLATTIAPEKLCISTQSDTGAQSSIWPSVENPRKLNFEVSLS